MKIAQTWYVTTGLIVLFVMALAGCTQDAGQMNQLIESGRMKIEGASAMSMGRSGVEVMNPSGDSGMIDESQEDPEGKLDVPETHSDSADVARSKSLGITKKNIVVSALPSSWRPIPRFAQSADEAQPDNDVDQPLEDEDEPDNEVDQATNDELLLGDGDEVQSSNQETLAASVGSLYVTFLEGEFVVDGGEEVVLTGQWRSVGDHLVAVNVDGEWSTLRYRITGDEIHLEEAE